MLNFFLALAICAVVSYFLGSINFAIITTKLFKGVDIRDYGSKNAGMTNVLRTVSKKAAIITFAGDFLKGFVSAFVSYLVFVYIAPESLINGGYIGTIFSMLGHMYPIFYGFRGGKGISVCAGAILFTDWRVLVLILTVFLIATVLTRFLSLGSILAAIGYTVFTFVLQFFFDKNPMVYINVLLALFSTIFAVYKHKENIVRLINKTENKIGANKENK